MKTQELRASWKSVAVMAGVAVLLARGVNSARGVTIQADGWLLVDQYGVAQTSAPSPGSITVRFPGAGAVPDSARVTLVPVLGSSGVSAFIGNYAAARVNSIAMKLTSNGATFSRGTRVVLRSGDREWKRPLTVPSESGVPVSNRIGLSLTDGWELQSGEVADLGAAWAADLRKVDALEVAVVRSGVPGVQELTISEFGLEADRTIGSIAPLAAALLERFGVENLWDVTPEQASQDSDGDGMTDLNEILAENDPAYYKNVLFKATVVEDRDGFTVRWPCVKGITYTVMRASSLRGVFVPVHTKPADHTGYDAYTDVDIVAGAQYFYKVVYQE